ncbi:MAG: DUF4376 domain-containing protein [Deltaproteobacteria bacterium]|nr:DUF4376 domain-containing protein [Deltaproteobacteria bacterium]
MDNYYGKPSESIQARGYSCPEGFVLMTEPRPTPDHICEMVNGIYIWKAPDSKTKKIEEAARIRKEIEISGIEITNVSCSDFRLDTDDAGQTKVTGAYILAKDNPESAEITKWYTLSGWRDVTNADIVKMGVEVNSHVKKTFEEMERIQGEIESLVTSEEIENYDIVFNI